MEFTRRDVVRGGLLGAAVVVGNQLLGPLAAHAVAPARVALPLARTTAQGTLTVTGPNAQGYRRLTVGPPESHVVRADLGIAAQAARGSCRVPLVAFAQLSDIHIVDHQSPARVEWVDRYDDPSDLPSPGIFSSAWRPQEAMTAHVADAMVRAINDASTGPVLGQPLQFAIETGDNSDNSQLNEIRWNIDVLDGETVVPDSGDLTRYEGVQDGDPIYYDTNYYHPDGTPAGASEDQWRAIGYPVVPGLIDAARAPFSPVGLGLPWYSAFGNHDGLVQGNFPISTMPMLQDIAVGPLKIISPPVGMSQATFANAVADGSLATLLTTSLAGPGVRAVTPDPDRRLLTRAEVVEEHFTTSGAPVGHGFTDTNRQDGTAYYFFDVGDFRMVVMDTVNPNGYADGSLDQTQFDWLKGVIDEVTDQAVLLFSHHTADTMENPLVGTGADPEPRVLGDALVSYLLTKPQVIGWFNGHTHKNQVFSHSRGDGTGGFWEVNTASHADYPQQARIIEVANNADGTLSIFATVIDHAAPPRFDDDLDNPLSLAALSRELSANDPQNDRASHLGADDARNVELLVQAPPGFATTCATDVVDVVDNDDDGDSSGSGTNSGSGSGSETVGLAAGFGSGAGEDGGFLPSAGVSSTVLGVAAAGAAAVVVGDTVRRAAKDDTVRRAAKDPS